MKRKILWLVVSCLMALSLVIASCAPAVVEEEKEEVVKEEVEKEVEKEVVALTVEKPKYGGVLKIALPLEADLYNFDPIVAQPSKSQTVVITNEPIMMSDWTKGPAGGYGSKETEWGGFLWEHQTGAIAESWELPTKIEGETATVIWHIRKGVHWALNPDSEASRLVGGRELTADDVVFAMKETFSDPMSWAIQANIVLQQWKVTSPQPWVVVTEAPWEGFGSALDRLRTTGVVFFPPEPIEKWGHTAYRDWKNSVGTGSFMLTSFVPASSVTLVRNPNYWMKDPIGPGKGNQLPYPDGIKMLIIVDASTRYAALRTAKIDWVRAVSLEDNSQLKKSTPQLMSAILDASSGRFSVRIDKPPFNDIRVRQALMMATDFEAIKRDLYGGVAEITCWPVVYSKDYAPAHLRLDDPDCPESVKELYTYNPEKAKQLLAEAGYPQGFKTHLMLGTTVDIIDYYSIIKDYWSRVGVDLELRPRETAALTVLTTNRNFDQLLVPTTSAPATRVFEMETIQGIGIRNVSSINDPVVNEAYAKIQEALAIPGTPITEVSRLYRELMKYVLAQAWEFPKVSPYNYVVWWPWLKNYSGETKPSTYNSWHTYVWLDQELKKAMGY